MPLHSYFHPYPLAEATPYRYADFTLTLVDRDTHDDVMSNASVDYYLFRAERPDGGEFAEFQITNCRSWGEFEISGKRFRVELSGGMDEEYAWYGEVEVLEVTGTEGEID